MAPILYGKINMIIMITFQNVGSISYIIEIASPLVIYKQM